VWCSRGAPKWPTHKNCNTLQHTTRHCNTLQHTATHCNTPGRIDVPCSRGAPKWPMTAFQTQSFPLMRKASVNIALFVPYDKENRFFRIMIYMFRFHFIIYICIALFAPYLQENRCTALLYMCFIPTRFVLLALNSQAYTEYR